MTTSVLASITPGGGPYYVTQTISATDSVGESEKTPNFCGDRLYSISSTGANGIAGLSDSELTIDATNGLISVYTANSAAIGTHTATLTVGLVRYWSIPEVTSSFQIII